MTRYNLLLHPPISEVGEQLTLPDDSLHRYGNYKGRVPDVTYLDVAEGRVRDIIIDFFIAPERIERVESELGRLAIYGRTLEGEAARVDIDHFKHSDSLGVIEVISE